jgi:hypothetical protein
MIDDASEAFNEDSPLWNNHIVLTRTGISLPDILCAVTDGEQYYCLLSIQVKAWKEKPRVMTLKKSEEKDTKIHLRFDSLIKNVSRTHFLDGQKGVQKRFKEVWNSLLKELAVFHVRVIVCWSGFTSMQIKLVNEFNDSHPNQPIVLVYPTSPNNNLFGTIATEALCQGVTENPWAHQLRLQDIDPEQRKIFLNAAEMELLQNEKLLEAKYEVDHSGYPLLNNDNIFRREKYRAKEKKS